MLEINNKLKDLNLKDCKVELIGNWFWISGKTFNIKEDLKNLGFFYSNNKKAWFYNGQSQKSSRGFYKDLNQLREKFISQKLEIAN